MGAVRLLGNIGLLMALGSLLALAACGDDGDPVDVGATVVAAVSATAEARTTPASEEQPAGEPSSPPVILETIAEVTEGNPLIVEVRIKTDTAAQVYVEYKNPDAGRFRTATTPELATEHVVHVARLRPDTDYTYDAFAIGPGGAVSAESSGDFETGKLPVALATIEHSTEGVSTTEILLLDYEDVAGSYIYALDSDANIVWYYASPNLVPDQPYAINAIRQQDDYNLVYYMGRNRRPCCLREITPLGEIVDNLSYGDIDGLPHHDQLLLADGEIMYLARIYKEIDDSANGGSENALVEGDSIRIWDRKTGTTREVWNAFDAFSTDIRLTWETVPFYGVPGQPEREGEINRWWNANSLQIGPRGNYVLSVKTHNQVISISPDFQHVEWVFGGPNGVYKFQAEDEKFYLPHTASELPNGNILIFDNGQDRPEDEGGEYTRVVEFSLSEYDLAAIKVWEYRPSPDLFSRTRGGAVRLDNGNTLVNFNTTPRVVTEVDRDGEELWRLEAWSPAYKGSYRAYALTAIMGETKQESSND
jgi:hypothetical protein